MLIMFRSRYSTFESTNDKKGFNLSWYANRCQVCLGRMKHRPVPLLANGKLLCRPNPVQIPRTSSNESIIESASLWSIQMGIHWRPFVLYPFNLFLGEQISWDTSSHDVACPAALDSLILRPNRGQWEDFGAEASGVSSAPTAPRRYRTTERTRLRRHANGWRQRKGWSKNRKVKEKSLIPKRNLFVIALGLVCYYALITWDLVVRFVINIINENCIRNKSEIITTKLYIESLMHFQTRLVRD